MNHFIFPNDNQHLNHMVYLPTKWKTKGIVLMLHFTLFFFFLFFTFITTSHLSTTCMTHFISFTFFPSIRYHFGRSLQYSGWERAQIIFFLYQHAAFCWLANCEDMKLSVNLLCHNIRSAMSTIILQQILGSKLLLVLIWNYFFIHQ